MFISATQATSAKAPSDASAVAFQVAIRQQQEFEEALKRTQERRELEQAAERERLAARQDRDETATQSEAKSDEHKAEVAPAGTGTSEGTQDTSTTRGVAVDVTA